MSLAQANKNLKYDKRMIERSLTTGEMTAEDLKKHLESLPDLSSNVEQLNIDGKSVDPSEEAH